VAVAVAVAVGGVAVAVAVAGKGASAATPKNSQLIGILGKTKSRFLQKVRFFTFTYATQKITQNSPLLVTYLTIYPTKPHRTKTNFNY
jgi:hypothetical protein